MILYHGSQNLFQSFSEEMIGSGYEANSALGIWLTRDPHLANAYGSEILIVTDVAFPRLAVASDYTSVLYGGPDLMACDREVGIPVFENMRRSLRRDGYDGVWCEMPGTDLEGAVCVFDASHVKILNIHRSPSRDVLEDLEDPFDDSTVDFTRNVDSFFMSSFDPSP